MSDERNDSTEQQQGDKVDEMLRVAGEEVSEEFQKVTPPPEDVGSVEIAGKVYSMDELESLIGKANASEKDSSDVEKMREELSPYAHIIGSEAFHEWLQDRVEMGEDEARPMYPQQRHEDTAGYYERMNRPGSLEVFRALQQYARTLPAYEQEAIDSNARLFNQHFDEMEKSFGDLKGKPSVVEMGRREAASSADPRQIAKYFESKEAKKDRAKVEPPGAARDEEGAASWKEKRRMETLQYQALQGDDDALLGIAESIMNRMRRPKGSDSDRSGH